MPRDASSSNLWKPPYVFGMGFAFTNAFTWMVALSTPLILLCEELGASPFEIGLVSSFGLLVLPLQVLATSLLKYLGYKRQVMLGWSIRALFLTVPLTLSILAPETPAPWMLPTLLASVFLFTIFRALGTSCFFPWIYAILPEGMRGRYYATEQAMMGISGVFTMLLSAWVMKALPVYAAFTTLYALSILGSILSVSCLGQLPDPERPRELHLARILRGLLPLVTARGPFRSYLLLLSTHALVNTSIQPFIIYYLRTESHLSDSRIFIYSAVQVVGSIIAAWIARRYADRTGARPFFLAALLMLAGVYALWFGLIFGIERLHPLIPAAFAAVGASGSLYGIANNKYSPQLAGDDDRAFVISVLGALVGFCGGVAPVVWGWLLKDIATGTLHLPRFAGFFAFGFVLQLLLVPWFLSLREKEPMPMADLSGFMLLRPFRWFGEMLRLKNGR